MAKKPRVPLTYADKQARLIAVAQEHIDGPNIYYQRVAHDDDCPTLITQSLKDCSCEPEFLAPEVIEYAP